MAVAKLPPGNGDDGSGEDMIFAEINITPLTDIFLVLLIIFMVSSSVIVSKARGQARTGMNINLPKGSAQEIPERARSMIVEIAPSGDIVADGAKIVRENVRGMFLTRFKDAPETLVILRADRAVPHGVVVEIMAAARDVGLRIAIATQSGQ